MSGALDTGGPNRASSERTHLPLVVGATERT